MSQGGQTLHRITPDKDWKTFEPDGTQPFPSSDLTPFVDDNISPLIPTERRRRAKVSYQWNPAENEILRICVFYWASGHSLPDRRLLNGTLLHADIGEVVGDGKLSYTWIHDANAAMEAGDNWVSGEFSFDPMQPIHQVGLYSYLPGVDPDDASGLEEDWPFYNTTYGTSGGPGTVEYYDPYSAQRGEIRNVVVTMDELPGGQ